jgi:hypothetical protein
MIEIHGLRCTKGAAIDEPGGCKITVMDDPPRVRLSLEHSSFPAMLTPDEARWFARELIRAADRVKATEMAGRAALAESE